jgi:hypothetical protein
LQEQDVVGEVGDAVVGARRLSTVGAVRDADPGSNRFVEPKGD